MTDQTSFERFGNKFQLKLLYYLLTDEKFFTRICEILLPEYFTNEHYVFLTTMIIEYSEQYNTVPTYDNLETIVNTTVEDEVQQDFLLKLVKLISSYTPSTDKDFIEEKTVEFCRQQAMKNAILQSVDLLKREDFETINELIQQAMNAGTADDHGHDYFIQSNDRTVEKRTPIATGMKMLDEIIAGGLSAGELGMVMAGTGVGKCSVAETLVDIAYTRITLHTDDGEFIGEFYPWDIVETQRGFIRANDLTEKDVLLPTPLLAT